MSRTTCGRGCVWDQRGNQTGHCSQCHRTFSSASVFDAHQRIDDGHVRCLDPLVLLSHGEPRFRAVIDKFGTTVWRTYADRPVGSWGKDAD